MKKFDFNAKRGRVSRSALIIQLVFILILFLIYIISLNVYYSDYNNYSHNNSSNKSNLDEKKFNILVSAENKDLEDIILNYSKSKKYDVAIEYAGTLDIMNKINKGERYDSFLISNSIWSYMIKSDVATVKDSKSTYITPVIFGIKKSKAEELGFIGKTVYTEDLVKAISSGDLKFTMSNPVTTNSGASAYLGMLYTLAGNPEVLTEEMLDSEEIKSNLKTFFSGLERTSGSEDFLTTSFLNGDYDAVFSYESSIIEINKVLQVRGEEPLYAIYPVDGVSICDNPFAYIDHKNDDKKKIFDDIQSYLLSNECQALLQKKGRRTWYGGVNNNVDKTVFNPDWGIDTTKYITPVKYPNANVIRLALNLYQNRLRKPVHVVFCLDYSGSMYGDGQRQLVNAMDYILTDKAADDFLQFSDEDKIDIITFSSGIEDTWSTDSGLDKADLLKNVRGKSPNGSTALYPAAVESIELLKNENTDKYNLSVILMTDGEGNVGTAESFKSYYRSITREIPIYSIMFGDAKESQLNIIANLTNGKIFDGKEDLVAAFKEVRGYN